jgi:DNA repair protein RAD50
MSCINKMTIQGIRSYGPKDQDTQIIEFFTPVTLIIGQNGCGKFIFLFLSKSSNARFV